MIGIVIAAHDHLAEALKQAAFSVLGDMEYMLAISIDPRDTAPDIQRKFQQAIEQVNSADGVLILTDMFGGTPANIGLTLHHEGQVELLTGVNLPMVIKAAQLAGSEPGLTAAAEQIKEVGVNAITVASDLLGSGSNQQESGHD